MKTLMRSQLVKSFFLALISTFVASCAFMHQFQLDSVDSETVMKGKKFEIIVSETGVNLQEATDAAKLFTQSRRTQGDMQQAQNIISMFQMGPRTGNMVFNEKYADSIMRAIQLKCPSGKISGMTSIRETAKYPVVSGEIVRIVGYCKEGA